MFWIACGGVLDSQRASFYFHWTMATRNGRRKGCGGLPTGMIGTNMVAWKNFVRHTIESNLPFRLMTQQISDRSPAVSPSLTTDTHCRNAESTHFVDLVCTTFHSTEFIFLKSTAKRWKHSKCLSATQRALRFDRTVYSSLFSMSFLARGVGVNAKDTSPIKTLKFARADNEDFKQDLRLDTL